MKSGSVFRVGMVGGGEDEGGEDEGEGEEFFHEEVPEIEN